MARADWILAEATITEVRQEVPDRPPMLIARVRPVDGSHEFVAEFIGEPPSEAFLPPHAGELLPVRCRLADRAVRIDLEDPRTAQSSIERRAQRRMREMYETAPAPAGGTAEIAEQLRQARAAGNTAEIERLHAAFKELLRANLNASKPRSATLAPHTAEIERLHAAFNELLRANLNAIKPRSATLAPQAPEVADAQAAAARHHRAATADPLDLIAQLAELHKSGALTGRPSCWSSSLATTGAKA